VTTKIVRRWLEATPTSAINVASGLSVLRGFACHLAQQDGRSQSPDPRLATPVRRKRPHIYTQDQIRQLLSAASRLKLHYDLGPLTYRTLFGLLASTGLRISEALNLRRQHINLQQGLLQIERTKFHKSRLVPLHPTVARALRRYAAARDRRWNARTEDHFFLGSHGRRLSTECAQTRFRQICDSLGWRQGNGEISKPRLHDLRHTFACHRLQRWYQAGQNVHQHIHALATYLGHSNVTNTYWYLTATPELLRTAGSRFERFAKVAGGRPS
jgi:integrase